MDDCLIKAGLNVRPRITTNRKQLFPKCDCLPFLFGKKLKIRLCKLGSAFAFLNQPPQSLNDVYGARRPCQAGALAVWCARGASPVKIHGVFGAKTGIASILSCLNTYLLELLYWPNWGWKWASWGRKWPSWSWKWPSWGYKWTSWGWKWPSWGLKRPGWGRKWPSWGRQWPSRSRKWPSFLKMT